MKKHIWHFAKFGGVTQLVFQTGDDIVHLKELDQKSWTALAMPTTGIFFDKKTAQLLDTDGDGFVRPPEILNAVDFLTNALHNLSSIMNEGTSLSLDEIKNEKLLESAKWILHGLQKNENTISLSDIAEQKNKFANTASETEIASDDSNEIKIQKIINSLLHENPDADENAIYEIFKNQANDFLQWQNNLQNAQFASGTEQMKKALAAVSALEAKADDFFVRCKLLDYDETHAATLSNCETAFASLSNVELTKTNETVRTLPLALPNAEKLLALKKKINPAWESELQDLYANAVLPLLGEKYELTENDWQKIKNTVHEFKTLLQSAPNTKVSALDVHYLSSLSEINVLLKNEIGKIIVYEKQKINVEELEKLLLFRRDFLTLLQNFVSFSNFYSGKTSLFQAGVLFFDSRSSHLCFEINGDARHKTLDLLSGAYLLYCDITRGKETRKIVALLTNGASDNIIVGRNGLFYDRNGNDWNAVVTKVIANPISIREAFFSPYKNFVRFVEDQIAKRASDAETKSNSLISSAAMKVASGDKTEAGAAPKKLDLGTIALIGTAVGGVSTLIAGILQAIFGLGYWVPIGFVGLLLLISGPSMILAAMKLRKRSIGPILEANGWAINAHAKVNIPFGASLTHLQYLPANAKVSRHDPFAEKKKAPKIIAIILALLVIGGGIAALFYFSNKAGMNIVDFVKTKLQFKK